MRIIDTN